MRLRDYQEKAVAEALQTRLPSLVVAPTGAGKGTMAAEALKRLQANNLETMHVVHRKELVRDTLQRLRRLGVAAGELDSDPRKHVRVTTIQALLHSRERRVGVISLDEAHHYAASEWARVKEVTKPQKILGWTATPQRADGRPLGDMFRHIIDAISYSELIERGYIVPARVVRPRGALGAREVALDPMDAYLKHGRNERALIYVRSVAEAEALTKRMQERGIDADCVHSRMPYDRVVAIMKDLERGKVQVVINCNMLTEGIDLPHVSCAVIARQCAHASTYIQIAGRVLRAHPDKEEATIIDLVGASHKHGMPAVDRVYSLEGRAMAVEPREDPRLSGRQYAVMPTEVLDIDLEVIDSSRTTLPEYAPPPPRGRGRPKKAVEPKPERVRPGPMPRSHGFIFEDRGYWQLRWREHGAKQQIGLATTDKAIAEEMLDLFRAEGPAVVQQKVLERRRDAISAFWKPEQATWVMTRWDGKRIRRDKLNLWTREKDVADRIVQMFKRGDDRQAYKLIATAKERWVPLDPRSKSEQMADWWKRKRAGEGPINSPAWETGRTQAGQ